MNPIVYIETSVVSYLTARPSRDLVIAARQMWTREWWELASQSWTLRISDLVLEEASRGDSGAAALRIEALRGIEALPITPEAEILAARLIERQALPPTEPEDALHVALATVSAAHYLVTWNFAHWVGPDTKLKLLDTLRACGYCPPLLTTPEELLEIMK
jgi:predicted nucleic acid-binding protein